MTTAIRPLPAHGTTARYQGNRTGTRPPCKCRQCVDAHTKACATRLLAHSAGTPPRVPTGPVADHVHRLLDAGMSRTQIAIVADVGVATVANVANQLHRTTHRTIADKILTVRPRIVRDTDRLDAVGTRRRLQALYAIGHSYRTLTAATGISDGTIRNIVASRAREVTATTYKSVRDAYLALRYQPGTSTRTVHSARENGWHTPDQWDDLGRIDDPSCQLETGEKPLTRNELAALRREEILHLTRFGATPEQIQTRLANDDLSLSHIRAVVAELRTGRKKDRRKQAVAS